MDKNCEFAGDCAVRNRRRQAQRLNQDAKRKGELVELAFLQKATDLGLIVSKPYGDSFPYDFIAQCERRLLRIQIKSAFTSTRRGLCVHMRHGVRRPYTAEEIDFVIVYLAPHDTWYVLPVHVISNLYTLRFYPQISRRKDGGRWEQYRDAWHLLWEKSQSASQPSEGDPAGQTGAQLAERSEIG